MPTLESSFGLAYWEFRDDRAQERHYALSWFLVRMLIEDDSPEVAGRFLELLENVRTSRDPWQAFRSTYDVEAVEALMNESLELWTRWTPAFGDWRVDPEAIEVDLKGSESALLLYRNRTWRGVPYELEFKLRSKPSGSLGLGFALGYVDADDYVILSVRDRKNDVVIAHRGGDEWRSKETVALDLPPDLDGLTLSCDTQGIATVAANGRVLLRHDLGTKAFSGRPGIWVDQRDADDFERMFIEFESITFAR